MFMCCNEKDFWLLNVASFCLRSNHSTYYKCIIVQSYQTFVALCKKRSKILAGVVFKISFRVSYLRGWSHFYFRFVSVLMKGNVFQSALHSCDTRWRIVQCGKMCKRWDCTSFIAVCLCNTVGLFSVMYKNWGC